MTTDRELCTPFPGITAGKKFAVHPLAKTVIAQGRTTDNPSEVDGNFYTAQDENNILTVLPQIITALK